MAPYPQYGAVSSRDEGEVSSVELPHAAAAGETFVDIGTVDLGGADRRRSSKWTKHHCLSYSLAAVICLVSARYWHRRAESYDAGPSGGVDSIHIHSDKDGRSGRVPVPPALSLLDPSADLGFRTTTRKGLALPSKAWGEHHPRSKGEDGEFTALPTNEWYLNLLSHKAASDPSTAGEIAHVYTVPYVLGVSPPNVPALPAHSKSDTAKSVEMDAGAMAGIELSPINPAGSKSGATMAGIELFMPVVKASPTNMQMVFDKWNGVALGAVVDENAAKKGDRALMAYTVDPNEELSPLGTSLKWEHVNMKTHVVRGMPYGTVRFGKNESKGTKNSFVLPHIMMGNRAISVLIDSDVPEQGSKDGTHMLCGSFTGKPVEQDPSHRAPLTSDGKPKMYTVDREVIFHMDQSDFTWVAFFSKPVKVECYSDSQPVVSVPGAGAEIGFLMRVVEVIDDDGDEEDDELVVRVALLDECTTGKSIIKEHCDHLAGLGYETVSDKGKSKEYLEALRNGAMLYPKSPLVGTEFPEDDEEEDGDRSTNVVFDWDVVSVNTGKTKEEAPMTPSAVAASSLRATSGATAAIGKTEEGNNNAFINFALPHHLETMSFTTDDDDDSTPLCLHTFHGRTCLVSGPVWNLKVEHGAPQSFLADRPPASDAISSIAEALGKDVGFTLSPNVMRGAADTYFPGKILAKMGRIIEINGELQRLKNGEADDYTDADDNEVEEAQSAAADVTLPSEEEVEALLDDLQQAVEIWLKPGGKAKGGAEAEFLYDSSWGGFVNCGCSYTFKKGHAGEGSCNNTFPECPALADVNEDFGNGWYNDHHFHFGYHIYAAAVVAKHRPEWGRKYYERVLLYIRDVANPSSDDEFFPMWRQKDWYLGNSWAAGLMSAELSPHGREQESSSEAIAAFEGIALFGNVMMNVFARDEEKLESARLVRNVGEMLTAMEVSAASRFWHVWGSKNDAEDSVDVSSSANGSDTNDEKPIHINTYPKKYAKPVVGMMHETMASFQTWFAPEDVVSYGIQLIPLTAVSERRDDPEWVDILYPVYAKSCKVADKANDGFCVDNGWSIVQAGLLAETGEIEAALEMASAIPAKVFISDGACGNSLTNTLWFISTRKSSPVKEI